jgi:poly(hydroxyalkanoate) depolymerase family esterase
MDLAKTFRRATARLRTGILRGAKRLVRLVLPNIQPRPSQRRPAEGMPAASPAETPVSDSDPGQEAHPPETHSAEAHAPEPRPPEPQPAPPASAAPPPATERMRRPLGDMLRLLEQGKGAMGWPARVPARRGTRPEIAPGARYEARHHAAAAGGRDYRLYVPASAEEGIEGLLVMLHGCKQDPDDFAAGTAMNAHAERARLLVAYPRQPRAANAMLCWNWFSPGDQRRDAGEPAIIAGLTRAIVAEFGLDGLPVMVAGLSAGGAMSAVMGATYPDLFTAVGIHSGLPYGAANDLASALAAMRGEHGLGVTAGPAVPTIVFHGDADRTVHPGNATRIAAAVGPGDTRRETGTSAGGRAFRREVLTGDCGTVRLEVWMIAGADHAWSGGDPAGTYTDPAGPDASAEMVRFMLAGHRRRTGGGTTGISGTDDHPPHS